MGDVINKNIKLILSPLLINIIPTCLYENSIFIKYKNPPSIMLAMYKYNKFTNVYFMLLNLKVIKHINILIIIFNIKSIILFILKNSNNILNPPTNDPNSILYIFTFLFNIIDTDNNNIKSIEKFNNITKSKYIFNFITYLIIKKKAYLLCRFLFSYYNKWIFI